MSVTAVFKQGGFGGLALGNEGIEVEIKNREKTVSDLYVFFKVRKLTLDVGKDCYCWSYDADYQNPGMQLKDIPTVDGVLRFGYTVEARFG